MSIGFFVRLTAFFAVINFSYELSEQLSDHDSNLTEYLFTRKQYNNLVRPVPRINDTLVVQLGLALIQLINVDEKNKVVITNSWIRLSWKDYQLQWTPSEFGNITVLLTDANKVWRPDIILFNNADGNYDVSWKPNVLIYSNGMVLWIPPTILKSSCDIDVTYFPFDEQTCQLRFGSWHYTSLQVTLGWFGEMQFIDLSDYWKSETWDIIDCLGEMMNETHSDHEPKTEIIYSLHIRRKTLYYTVNLICPCALIVLLTISVFNHPTDGGEKITLSITVLLSLVVFFLLVNKILPPTSSSVPLISKYLLFTFFLNSVVIVFTVIIININYRTPQTHQMPKWMRYYFMELFPPILFMKRLPHIDDEIKSGNKNKDETIELLAKTISEDETEIKIDNENEQVVSVNVHGVVEDIAYISKYYNKKYNHQKIITEWKYVASVINKLMLIIFSVVTIVGTFGILLNVNISRVNILQDDVIKNFSSSSYNV